MDGIPTAHATAELNWKGYDMARFVKRWWKAAGLCAAAALGLAFAAKALDHALLDARVDPPDVVSVGGALSDPVPTAPYDSVSKMCA